MKRERRFTSKSVLTVQPLHQVKILSNTLIGIPVLCGANMVQSGHLVQPRKRRRDQTFWVFMHDSVKLVAFWPWQIVTTSDNEALLRRGGRVAEGAPLLREYTLTRIEGSNPFLSARCYPHSVSCCFI